MLTISDDSFRGITAECRGEMSKMKKKNVCNAIRKHFRIIHNNILQIQTLYKADMQFQ